jgi:hypothetical protein
MSSDENKGDLTGKLEADRQNMAIQLTKLQRNCNVPRRFRVSFQERPWGWILGAVMTGFLLSRLPPRQKKVYVWPPPGDAARRDKDRFPIQDNRLKKPAPGERGFPDKNRQRSRLAYKLWSSIKPILSAYLGREIYQRINRSRSFRGPRESANGG